MTIYTSYYAKLQHKSELFEDKELIVTSNTISRYLPKEQREKLVTTYQSVFKPGDILYSTPKDENGKIDEDIYTKAYLELLRNNYRVHANLFEQVIELAEQNDIVLFCWEKSGKFCHRHLLACYLTVLALEKDILLCVKELQ